MYIQKQNIFLSIFLILLADASRKPDAPKHILFFLIDDLGFADVSYKAVTYPNVTYGKPIPTPTIDSLAINGVRLESYYVVQLCSPTRTSLLSGRYSYNIGMSAEVIVNGHPSCMPLNIKTIADHLHEGGWHTSAFGKWDCGMTAWGCTPTCRGFNNFSGFYNAFNDYFTHRVQNALDLRQNFHPDFKNQNESGIYMTELITSYVEEWITETLKVTPSARTFTYVAHQAVHGPMQVPKSYMQNCNHIPESHPTRKILCGMVQAVDESVLNITETYKRLGIWNDTIFIFSTDNGGNPDTGGNNWPLRGQKATVFEGGVRGVGFVYGSGLESTVRGKISHEMIHVTDWLPTIVEGIANLSLKEANDSPPLDGFNQWTTISTGTPSPRTEMLLNLNPKGCKTVQCRIPGQGAVRVGRWKLLHGYTSVWAEEGYTRSSICTLRSGKPHPRSTIPITANTSSPWCPNGWTPPPESGVLVQPPPDINCTHLPCTFNHSRYIEGGTFLFDVIADPYERHDVSREHPDIVSNLLAKLKSWNATNIPQDNSPVDKLSDPAYFGDVWTPWRGDPNPLNCSTNTSGPPGENVKSHFDGGKCNGTYCVIAGWLWDPDQSDGGIAPMTVVIYLDQINMTQMVAKIPRPGIVPKTGAPNPEHGFNFNFLEKTISHGKYHIHTFALVGPSHSMLHELNHSPICYCNAQECAC